MSFNFENLKVGMLQTEIHLKIIKIIDGISTKGNPYLHMIAMDSMGKKSRLNAWNDDVLSFKMIFEEKQSYKITDFEVIKVNPSYKLDSPFAIILQRTSHATKLEHSLDIPVVISPETTLSSIRNKPINSVVTVKGILTMITMMKVN